MPPAHGAPQLQELSNILWVRCIRFSKSMRTLVALLGRIIFYLRGLTAEGLPGNPFVLQYYPLSIHVV